jgi:hypothetical protein
VSGANHAKNPNLFIWEEPMQTIQNIAIVIGLILALGNLCTMIYALVKLLSKPQDDLNARVREFEAWKVKVNVTLDNGKAKMQEHSETNEIIIKSVLALIEFEMEYCTTEHKVVSKALEKAKDELHGYLARK